MRILRTARWVALAALVVLRAAASSAAVMPAAPLVVAVAESPPFAVKNADGTWSGLSVDLWRQVADELGLRFTLREVDLDQVDGLLRDRTVDVALGAIAVSAEGEATHDFSQPYYATGLGFAELSATGPSWRSAIEALMSSQLLHILAVIAAATIFVGILIAFIERRHNADQFGGPLHRGIATGVWWAAVTMTTVGYGDAAPKTTPGRSLALVWMFVGVVGVAIFTATVTSILTIGSLQSAAQQQADLARLRLGATSGSAGALWLTRQHLRFTASETYEAALDGLATKRVDAVVANKPVLHYLVARQWQGVLRVSPIVLEPLVYAFGLPSGSALREPIDRTMLRIVEQSQWRDVEREYLGHS